MPELNELGLTEESAPQVDWDAPEAGQTPPAVYPGVYTLKFKLPENHSDWYDTQEVQMVAGNPASKRKFLIFKPEPFVLLYHSMDGKEAPVPADAQTGLPIQLPPQRVSFYKSAKMNISQGAEWLRAMGARLNNITQEIDGALKQLDGRAQFKGEVGWRAFFRSTETTVSTHPRKKKGELPWPREADGTPSLMATNPQTGEKAYGYPEIFRIILPTTK